ncbi:hypothetical protein KAR91_48580, partial [Candidatus Pacearchaeota archaeon]|nr:hypothetical protein [Candidatus Pacearchaeota archaeon]
FLLIESIVGIRKYIVPVFILVVILVAVTTNSPNWGRTSWSNDWFNVSVPSELTANSQMIIILGSDPISYLIPSFPLDTRFVRIEGNFKPSSETKFAEYVRQTIRSNAGPIYSLSLQEPTEQQIRLLAGYGLTIKSGDIIHFGSKVQPVILIHPLFRIPSVALDR